MNFKLETWLNFHFIHKYSFLYRLVNIQYTYISNKDTCCIQLRNMVSNYYLILHHITILTSGKILNNVYLKVFILYYFYVKYYIFFVKSMILEVDAEFIYVQNILKCNRY